MLILIEFFPDVSFSIKLDIKKFYNERKFKDQPDFEELDRIELKDFYGDTIYEYNSSNQ